jgi:nucleoside-diphosphate-sugar epimerase
MKKRLLIVGCGDVARRAQPALEQSYRVVALSRSGGPGCMSADLDRPETLEGLAEFAGDRVLHCAPPQREGQRDERTRVLLAALERAMVPRRLVYLSTTGVYGDCGGEWVDEARAPNPQSERAQRRVDAEAQLTEWCGSHGTELVILRIPGIYAADRLPLERLRNGTLALRSEDDVYTNHVHADDLAAIVVRALDVGAPSGVFNASDDSEILMADFFDLVADRAGLPRPPRASRSEVERRVSPQLWSFMRESRRISNRRMKAELGVQLRYPTVREGVPLAAQRAAVRAS